MPLDAILDRRLTIISGKGGVGKTTMAAAVAVIAARHNKRVVIAEVEGKDSLSEIFGVRDLSPDPVKLRTNLYAMNITPEEALEEYFEVQFHMRKLAKPLVSSQLVDYVTHAAPGLRDLLLLGKVWYAATRRKVFDLIVLDTPASGHTVSMLRSPEGFLQAVSVGPLAGHARQVLEWLQDPSQVSINLVSLPEEMPVNETIETTRQLEDKLGMNVDHVLLNQMLPPVDGGEDPFKGITSAAKITAAAKRDDVAVPRATANELLRCLEFYRSRYAIQHEHTEEIEEELGGTAQILRLPFMFSERVDSDSIDSLADALEKQLA